MTETIFDQILKNKIKSWPIWEDANYLAFLTPFPNTPGATVVIPKKNPGGYLFKLTDKEVTGLILAASKVAKILEDALKVKRVAMVVEGTGVNDHVHVKLYPLHGKLAAGHDVWGSHTEFYPEYIGYLSTAGGPKMSDAELKRIQSKITKAAKD
jgi:diadenosine tetraphosphate (Ap4A) HIT family hydrolase